MRMRADGARLLCAQHAARQGPHNEEIEEASHHAGIVARLTHVFDGREDEMARLLGYILGKLPVLHLFCLHLSVTRVPSFVPSLAPSPFSQLCCPLHHFLL